MPLAEIRKQVRIQEAYTERCRQRLSATERLIAEKEAQQAALAQQQAALAQELEELRAYLGVDKHTVDGAKEFAEEYKACVASLEEEAASGSSKIDWKSLEVIQLNSEETVQDILKRIDEHSVFSPFNTISWAKGSPFHPSSRMPSRILGALAFAPERRLSFQQLLYRMLFPLHGEDLLQAYLREMLKQGLISIA